MVVQAGRYQPLGNPGLLDPSWADPDRAAMELPTYRLDQLEKRNEAFANLWLER